jgi:hypothetical protein
MPSHLDRWNAWSQLVLRVNQYDGAPSPNNAKDNEEREPTAGHLLRNHIHREQCHQSSGSGAKAAVAAEIEVIATEGRVVAVHIVMFGGSLCAQLQYFLLWLH